MWGGSVSALPPFFEDYAVKYKSNVLAVAVMMVVVPCTNLALATESTTDAKADETRCRSIRELGTRIPKRICKTNAEWAREREEARRALEQRNRSSHCSERC